MIRQVNVKAIYAKIAKENDLDIHEVEAAARSQFAFVKKVMEEGKFEGVRLPFFGRFWVKPGRKEMMDLRKKLKNEREAKLLREQEGI
jgi:hypothetical protein